MSDGNWWDPLVAIGTGGLSLAWDEWQRQRQWKREDTAVQRRVADLKAAGLSPVLAAGSAATSQPISTPNPTNSIQAALGARYQMAQIAKTQAEANLANEAARVETSKWSNGMSTMELRITRELEQLNKQLSILNVDYDNAVTNLQRNNVRLEIEKVERDMARYEWKLRHITKIFQYGSQVGSAVGNFGSGLRSFAQFDNLRKRYGYQSGKGYYPRFGF